MVDLIRSPTLDRPKAEFSGFDQGDRLVMPPDFVSVPNLVARLSFEGMKPSAFLKIADEEAEPPHSLSVYGPMIRLACHLWEKAIEYDQ